jgi:hypothetical protein
VNGTSTRYTLDIAGQLSEVLADGTDTYLYGADRLAQEGSGGRAYYLGDALGSVRQLVGAADPVMLVKSYDPYGNVIQSNGMGTSIYGFAGEETDLSGNQYLRARSYDRSRAD